MPGTTTETRRWRNGTHGLALTLVLLMLVLGGCATTGNVAPDTAHQEQLGRVAIVAIEQEPELKFEGFVHGKGAGAAAGAGGTFAACLGGMGSGGCSGAFCGAALILMLGICSVAGLIGGVAGAATAPSADQAKAGEDTLIRAFEVRTIQHSVRQAIEDAARAAGAILVNLPEDDVRPAAAARDYRSLAGRGIDTVLETTLTKAGTSGAGINSPSMAYMQVQVRLVDAVSNAEKYSTDYLYQGRSLDLAGWSAQQAKPLLDELEKGYRSLGTHIYDSIFELHPFPDRGAHSAGGMLSTAFGLAPIAPPTRGQLTADDFISRRFEWFEVDSMRPHLKWEAFPRASDIAATPESMSRAHNVRYDLVIAREENMAAAEIVYRKEGLLYPEHTPDLSLRPETRYFWTVRARFELDGRNRVTEWGSTHFVAREKITAPSRYSYRFRTPATNR
jgi:hypothetical protein